MNKYCIITTAVSNLTDAKKITKSLLEKRLIACCQMQEINSSYWWEDRIENTKEYLLTMKTKTSLYREVEEEIVNLHPYEVPEVEMIELNDGYYRFINWIKDVTTNPKIDL